MKILVVEDETRMRELLMEGLGEAGFEVDSASDGETGLRLVIENRYDLTILDAMLPNIDGFEVCKRLRSMGDASAVLMLTAKHEVASRIAGLDAGADDYLVKPFSFGELLARVRALIRRRDAPWPHFVEYGRVRCDMLGKRVVLGNDSVHLSDTEFDLFVCMIERNGLAISRGRILEEVWEFPYSGSANVVDQYIAYLRRKLASYNDLVSIETVRGLGYRMVLHNSDNQS